MRNRIKNLNVEIKHHFLIKKQNQLEVRLHPEIASPFGTQSRLQKTLITQNFQNQCYIMA